LDEDGGSKVRIIPWGVVSPFSPSTPFDPLRCLCCSHFKTHFSPTLSTVQKFKVFSIARIVSRVQSHFRELFFVVMSKTGSSFFLKT
jgi:hypothetical protein